MSDQRYAHGEIDTATFEQMREQLKGRSEFSTSLPLHTPVVCVLLIGAYPYPLSAASQEGALISQLCHKGVDHFAACASACAASR